MYFVERDWERVVRVDTVVFVFPPVVGPAAVLVLLLVVVVSRAGSISVIETVRVEITSQAGMSSVMETVEVRKRAQDPTVVDAVPLAEQPVETTLLRVVQEDGEPAAHETAKLVTVAAEQLVVVVVASSVAWQPRTGMHVEINCVVEGPTDWVSTQTSAVSVLQLVGLEENVGWPLGPTVMAGHDGRLPLRLMPGGRLILGRGGGPLLKICQCRLRVECQARRSTHGG